MVEMKKVGPILSCGARVVIETESEVRIGE